MCLNIVSKKNISRKIVYKDLPLSPKLTPRRLLFTENYVLNLRAWWNIKYRVHWRINLSEELKYFGRRQYVKKNNKTYKVTWKSNMCFLYDQNRILGSVTTAKCILMAMMQEGYCKVRLPLLLSFFYEHKHKLAAPMFMAITYGCKRNTMLDFTHVQNGCRKRHWHYVLLAWRPLRKKDRHVIFIKLCMYISFFHL